MIYDNTETPNSRLLPTRNVSNDVKISDNVQNREGLISKLKSIIPKYSLDYKLLSNPDYLNRLTDKQINLILIQ